MSLRPEMLKLSVAFGFTEKRNSLDAQAAEIADTQDVSAQSRKKLAEDTRCT